MAAASTEKGIRLEYNDPDEMSKEELLALEQEEEFRKLQIYYMQNQKKHQSYILKTKDIRRRQRHEIKMLQREREELMKNLRKTESSSNHRRKTHCCEKIGVLLQQTDEKQADINEEITKIKELDVEVKEWEKLCKKQRKETGGDLAVKQRSRKEDHDGRVLENRLDQALKRLNTQLTDNRKLRQQINVFATDRKRNDFYYARLERNLQILKKEQQHLVESSKQAMSIREEAQQKMVSLRERDQKEQRISDSERKDLRRMINHDKKIREFMSFKEKEVRVDPQQLIWKTRIANQNLEKNGDPESERRIALNDGFSNIKYLMEEEDLNNVVQKFIEGENNNFALFNLVNEFTNQEESLQNDCTDLKRKIKLIDEEGVRHVEQRRVLLEELDAKLQNTSKELEFLREKDKSVLKQLDNIRSNVQKLFQVTKCDTSALDCVLNCCAGDVKVHNIMLHLSVVEDRATELLMMQAYIEYRAEGKIVNRPPSRPSAGKSLDPLAMLMARRRSVMLRHSITGLLQKHQQLQSGLALPNIGDDATLINDEIGDSRPLTRDEMQMKVSEAIRKRDELRNEALRTSTELIKLHSHAPQAAHQSKSNLKSFLRITIPGIMPTEAVRQNSPRANKK